MAKEVIIEMCDIVAERGVRLVVACIVGLIKKLGRLQKEEKYCGCYRRWAM